MDERDGRRGMEEVIMKEGEMKWRIVFDENGRKTIPYKGLHEWNEWEEWRKE